MKNIKDYNLEQLKDELESLGEKNIEQNKSLNGFT